MDTPEPRKGMPSPELNREDFTARFLSRFADPAFEAEKTALERIAGIAWDGYSEGRKSPVTRKAGAGYADPAYDLSIDWINAHEALKAAQARHEDPAGPLRALVVNGSSRSEHTCPGEMSKSFRLATIAEQTLQAAGVETTVLDLSRLASEFGRTIHPCKACFSTAAPLCHWPCSCYPNYSLGQVDDWMNDIYPLWVEAHGVFLVTPVNWYQVSSPMKLMMDRMVCADGGNPDPTLTHGKDAKKAKEEELKGWDYPRHLEGRIFSVVVHGDVEGAENVRRSISDWLKFMKLTPAGPDAELDRYIGYWEPYATSHDALDKDTDIQAEVTIAAEQLARSLKARREGRLVTTYEGLESPRQK
ncbi:flavodoxin family protein [Brevundimonas sp. Root1279]|uniref:flavodoxin family protein n=1 Tax=Brevundimonas sp. Root1279 TaxID=1736443 RepID=UPI0006F72E8D|nr:flavodoxin family protein [Brevundimonas sp. Root1279]KQW82268.1 NADPH-dependent FMN reductase [Brevundimonas sp. Root1279]